MKEWNDSRKFSESEKVLNEAMKGGPLDPKIIMRKALKLPYKTKLVVPDSMKKRNLK